MSKYKPGDNIIILDYNGKPLVPQVVAKIEEGGAMVGELYPSLDKLVEEMKERIPADE